MWGASICTVDLARTFKPSFDFIVAAWRVLLSLVDGAVGLAQLFDIYAVKGVI